MLKDFEYFGLLAVHGNKEVDSHVHCKTEVKCRVQGDKEVTSHKLSETIGRSPH